MGAPLIFYGWPPNRRAGRVAERRWRLYRNCVACCNFCESLAIRIADCPFSPVRIEPFDRLAGAQDKLHRDAQRLYAPSRFLDFARPERDRSEERREGEGCVLT